MDSHLLPGIPWAVPVLAAMAIWYLVVNLISRLTGWARLSAQYRCDDAFQGRIWNFQSVAMRMGAGYNNCVRVGCRPRGPHLSLFFFFRPGHPPLFVRWPEISIARKKKWGINKVELRFQRTADIPVTINTRLAQRLAEKAGTEWPDPEMSRPGS